MAIPGLILLTSLKIRPEIKDALCEPCVLERPEEKGERKKFGCILQYQKIIREEK